MRLYLAGPMTGLPAFNFPAFDAAAHELRLLGHEVCNPAEHDREQHGDKIEASATGDPADAAAVGFSLREALAFDLSWIAENADGVAVLDGWQDSKGARAEVALAHALGLVVAPVEAWWPAYHARPFDASRRIEPALPVPVSFEAFAGANAAPDGEVRVTSTTGGEKGSKPARFDLIPAAPLWHLAELYGKGAEKYEDRNWERGYPWSLSFAAMMRHAWLFWQGVDVDAETGKPHLASVAWHAFALMEWAVTHPEFDNRPGAADRRNRELLDALMECAA